MQDSEGNESDKEEEKADCEDDSKEQQAYILLKA